jgi:hypothetical protein
VLCTAHLQVILPVWEADVEPQIWTFLETILPSLTILTAILAMLIFLSRGSIQVGKFRFDFEKATAERVRERIKEDIAEGASPQNALMREYHAQGLSQSRVSFWFSLTFASLGFAMIALAVGVFLQRIDNPNAGWLETAGKPLFTLIAGTVIDAVSALFFVQSNKARQLMTEFFDKLRVDRKLDEALRLMSEIPDPTIASRIKGIVALTFSEVAIDNSILSAMLSKLEHSNIGTDAEEPGYPSQEKPRVVDPMKATA